MNEKLCQLVVDRGGKKKKKKPPWALYVCLSRNPALAFCKDEEYRGGFEEAAVVCEVDNMFTDVCREQINK